MGEESRHLAVTPEADLPTGGITQVPAQELLLFTPEELYGLIFQAGGAATAPILKDNPRYVFPSERVAENLRQLLREEFPETPVPLGYRG